jgi:hypothetical protein
MHATHFPCWCFFIEVGMFVLAAEIFILYNNEISHNWYWRFCKESKKQFKEFYHLETVMLPRNY